jgi:molybdopterin-guanine dinucleotide biosynthesis protein
MKMVNEYAFSQGIKLEDVEDKTTFKDEKTGLVEIHIGYIVGDALLHNPGHVENIIKFDLYEGTFLRKYAVAVKDFPRNSKLRQFKIAKDIILEMAKDGEKYKKPSSEEVVVHVRMGDVFLSEALKSKYFLSNLPVIMEIILGFKKKNITIVSASKTSRTSQEQSKIANEKSVKELDIFIRMLEEKGLVVKIKSSKDVDEDFFYLCFAKNLVLTGCSGFGEIAKTLNKMVK